MIRGARLLLVAVFVSSAAPVLAANKDIERLQVQMAFLQGQLTDMQRTVDETARELKRLNESLADQGASLKRTSLDRRTQDESLQSTLRELTERVSELSERVQQMQTAQAAAAAAPVMAQGPMQSGPVGTAPAPGPAAPVAAPAMAPRELYSQAYADYARGNFDLAIQEYQEYLRSYPSTDLSDNAQYWIGECHYAKARYQEAIEAWNTLFRDYPASDKLPDGRFKKGMALEKLGRRSQALVEYRYVMERFPNSEAGRRAREKLNP